MVLLEVCVDSIISAANASEAGAGRVELCSALSEGGLTPSLGLFLAVKKAIGASRTKIFCMVRIRRGDFDYSDDEIGAMIEDVKFFKSHGADGIVFGFLTSQNKIHVENCQQIVNVWGAEKPMTFHRAFDETNRENFEANIDLLEGLGVSRILSSGFEPSAEGGIENLKKMVSHTKGKSISILVGAGVKKENVAKIIAGTGCKEVHASARAEVKRSSVSKLSMGGGNEDLQPLLVCDPLKVKELIEIANSTANETS